MASPFVTAGGGFIFEDYVVALYLAYLLQPQAARGLPPGMITQSVAAQQGPNGWPLDDLLVHALNEYEKAGRLSLQLKESLTVSSGKNNSNFRDVVKNSWETLRKEDFSYGYDRVGAGVSDITSDSLRAIREIFGWAEFASDSAYFFNQINLEGYSNNSKRKVVAAVREIIEKHINRQATDEELFRFFKHFSIIRFEFGSPGAADDHSAVEWCRHALDRNEASRAPDLWNELLGVAKKIRVGGSAIKRDTLLFHLRHRFKIAGAEMPGQMPAKGPDAIAVSLEEVAPNPPHVVSATEEIESAPAKQAFPEGVETLEEKIARRLDEVDREVHANGFREAAKYWYAIRDDVATWSALSPKLQARVLRSLGREAIVRNDLAMASELSNSADAISAAVEPRLKAMIALRKAGPVEAMRTLGNPTTIDGKLFRAGLLLEQQDVAGALSILDECSGEATINAEWNRLRSLAAALAGNRESALSYASDAVRIAPEWRVMIFNNAMLKYQCARSRALGSSPIPFPDPIPLGLCLQDRRSRALRDEALATFRDLQGRKEWEQENRDMALWVLACLACDSSRIEEAETCCKKLLEPTPIDPRVVFWALARGYKIPYESVVERLLESLRGPQPEIDELQGLLACRLSMGHIERARLELAEFEPLFSQPDDLKILERWHVRADINDGAQEGEETGLADLISILDQATHIRDSVELERLLKAHLDRADIVLALCDLLASRGDWLVVAEQTKHLVNVIGGPEAIRIACYACFNTGAEAEALAILADQTEAFPESRIPLDLQRLRTRAASRQGLLQEAISYALDITGQSEDVNDRLILAELYVQEGDIRRAAAVLYEIPDEYLWSGANALSFSAAVIGENKVLAGSLLQKAIKAGLPNELIGNGIALAYRLGMDGAAHDLLAIATRDAGIMQKAGLKQASIDDVMEMMRRQADASAQLSGMYRKGEIPLHLILPRLNGDLPRVWDFAFSDAKSQPILVRSGNRPLDFFAGALKRPPEIVADLSALLTMDRIGLLEEVLQATGALRIPPYLPQALRYYADHATHNQPSHVQVLAEVVRAVESGRVAVDGHLTEGAGKRYSEVVYELDEKAGSEEVSDGINGQITLGALGIELVRRGLIGDNDFERIRTTYNSWKDARASANPQTATALLFSGNTLEAIILAGLLGTTATRFTISIDRDYLAHCRATIAAAREGAALSDRLKSLLLWVVGGQERGIIQMLAVQESRRNDAEATFDKADETTRAMVDVLTATGKPERWLWIDDRYATGFSRNNDGVIVSTFEVLQLLRNERLITRERYFKALIELREHHVYILPIAAEEVIFWLDHAPVLDDVVVETPELATLRAYLNEILLLEPELDLDHARVERQKIMESQCLLELNALARTCLLQIWSGQTSAASMRLARSTWVWESLRIERFERLPLLQPTPEAKRLLWVFHATHLLLIAISIDNAIRDEDESLRQLYIRWLQFQLADINDGGNREIARAIARNLADVLLEDVRAASKVSSEGRDVARHIAQSLFSDLPEVIRDQLVEMSEFREMAGLKAQSITVVGDNKFSDSDFWEAIDTAADDGASTLMAQDGTAYQVRISTTPPIAIEMDGAESIRVVDSGFDLLAASREIRSRYVEQHRLEISLPDDVLPIELIDGERRPSERAKMYRTLQETFPEGRYLRIEQAIEANAAVEKSMFLPVSIGMYRRDIGWPESASTDLNTIFKHLAETCGIEKALHRLAGVPVELLSGFETAFSILTPAEQLTLIQRLILAAPTPQRLFRALQLISASTAEEAELLKQTRLLYDLVLEHWDELAGAFIEVLRWSERAWSQDVLWASSSDALRLACIWSHADRIFAALLQKNVSTEWIREHFHNMHASPILSSMRWDAGTEADVAAPTGMSSIVLLASGLNMASKRLVSRPDLLPPTAVLNILKGEGEIKLASRIQLLEDRSQGANALGSYLADDYNDYIAGEIVVEGMAVLSETARQDLRRAVREALQGGPDNDEGWISLGALGPQWLNPSEVIAISQAAERFQFPSGDLSGKKEGILLIIARVAPSLPEKAREILERNLLAWGRHLSKEHKNPGIYLNPKIDMPASIRVFIEILLALARASTKDQTIRRFMALVDRCILEWPESSELWRAILNNALRRSSYVNLEVLWPTFVRLRAAR